MAADRALKRTVEQELTKLGTHVVTDSVEDAEIVLLLEGSYIALAASVSSNAGEIPSDADQPPPPLGTSAQPGDWQRNLLQSVLAIAVPIGAYRANRGDIPALLAARIWEGSEVYQPPYRVYERFRSTGVTRWETRLTWESASPELLVWQLAGRKPRPASHPPLCAASSQTFLDSAIASTGAVVSAETKAQTAGGSGSTAGFVTVPVSVTDGAGRAIVDLDPSLFRIYEDETLQVIDRMDRPGASVDVTLLIDTSSSMRRKADEMHVATLTAINAFSRIGAPVIVSFDRRVVQHSTARYVGGRQRPAINQPSPALGRTATRLYDALDLLLTGPLKAPAARAALVILTDGVDTASRLADGASARRRVGESTIPTYVIHYDTVQDIAPLPPGGGVFVLVNGEEANLKPTLLPEEAADPGPAYTRAAEFVRQITDISGGRLYVAPASDDLEKTFDEIATELSQQYLVTYRPTNQTRNSAYRRIRVEVDRSDVSVRARAGYYQSNDIGNR